MDRKSWRRYWNVDSIAVAYEEGTTHIAGKVEVGQRVDIKATMASCADGSIVATHVVGKAAPGVKKPKPIMVQGTITSIVPDGSMWTIDVANGDAFIVHVDSKMNSGKKTATVGMKVKVFALEQDDDSYIAKKIIIIPGKGPNK